MKWLVLMSAAVGAGVLSSAPASAQTPAVSEEEIRCFVDGVCTIEQEKKWSIARIGSSRQERGSQPAAAAPATRTAPRAMRDTRTTTRSTRATGQRHAEVRRTSVPRVAQRGDAMNMSLSFRLGSAELTPEARAQADAFAKVLRESTSGGTFSIEGHTDSSGTRASNLDLSQRRAQSVVAHLVERGVPEAKLRAVGFGFDRPKRGFAASNPANRRVEIVRN